MDLQPLVTEYLEHLIDRIKMLTDQGKIQDALVLEDSGLQMARAYDMEEEFLYIEDLSLRG